MCLILHNVRAVSSTPFSQGTATSPPHSMLAREKLSHFCCRRSRTNRRAKPGLRWQKSGMLNGTDSFCVIAGRRQDRKYLNIADFAPDDKAASMCRAALRWAIAIEIQINTLNRQKRVAPTRHGDQVNDPKRCRCQANAAPAALPITLAARSVSDAYRPGTPIWCNSSNPPKIEAKTKAAHSAAVGLQPCAFRARNQSQASRP